MKHTKGPWKVSSNEPSNEYACVILEGEYNGIIAKAELSVYHDTETAEANAKLIASAPELLEENERLNRDLTEVNTECERLQSLNSELLEALKCAIQYVKAWKVKETDPLVGDFLERDIERIESAIKKATV